MKRLKVLSVAIGMTVSVLMVQTMIITPTFAQDGFKGEHFIEVTGTAMQEVEPNEIFVNVRLREFEENKEKVTLEKLDKEFLDALKESGIDRSRIELASAGSQLGRIGRKDKDAFREKTYQLKLTSGAELEKFLVKIEPVKVMQVAITKVSHSESQKLRMELKIKALQAARTKAEALVKSIGSEIGKPLMIREFEEQPYHQPYPNVGWSNVMLKDEYQANAGQEPDPTAFRKITLQAQVTAQFEIK